MAALASRGRLRPLRGKETQSAGKALKGPTLNRYASEMGSLHRYARRLRVLPRGHRSWLAGWERAPEPADPDRYLRLEAWDALPHYTRDSLKAQIARDLPHARDGVLVEVDVAERRRS